MKFREKTYLITLVLFLVFLNTGIFSLTFYTYRRSVDSAKEVCYAEEHVIAEAFGNDTEYLSREESLLRVMSSYGDFYAQKKIYIAFVQDGETLYSSLPEGVSVPEAGYAKDQRISGERYFTITEEIAEGRFIFTYAKDLRYLDKDFRGLAMIYVPTSLLASTFLALCLFLVLRRLASPLERLHIVAGEIADGNFAVRADERGKDEFSALAKDFNRIAEHVEEHIQKLEENARLKQRMLDDLAHEMRTPLTSIRGYAEFLQIANIPKAEQWEAAEYIISEAERLKQIGERLLDEAFIRENGICRQNADLSEAVSTAVKALHVKAKQAGVTLLSETEQLVTECDPLLLGMLMTNLTDNAVKACSSVPHGEVTVGCKTDESGRPLLFVRDNGIGMTQDQLARITEPFYRTDKSRSRSEGGTGLGLSLCAQIVAAHDGTLEFTSAPGQGTTALVRLKKVKILQISNISRTDPTHCGSILFP